MSEEIRRLSKCNLCGDRYIEAEIERSVMAADVGIVMTKNHLDKTVYESDLEGNRLKISDLKKLGFEADASDSSDSEAEDDDDDAARKKSGNTLSSLLGGTTSKVMGFIGRSRSSRVEPVSAKPAPSWTVFHGGAASKIMGFIGGGGSGGGGARSASPASGSRGSRKNLSMQAQTKKVLRGGDTFVIPPKRRHINNLPVVKRNGPNLCGACGINYVRFIIAFPIESLKRNVIMWKNPADKKGVYLPFDRAVGTAMVYAFLDVKNVVSHVEMGSRIYDAAQLPWLMPTGITFPLLVAEFKAMLSGNLTGGGWMKRSNLWNIVALQNQEGAWGASDSLAGALKATDAPEARPPIATVAGGRPTIKSYYSAEALLKCCPPSLMACSAQLGWITVDSMWWGGAS